MKHNRSHKKHFILLTVLAVAVLLFTACASSTPRPMTPAKAKSIIFDHIGITKAEAKLTRTELDADDGILSYEVDLIANGAEYEYDVDAFSGEILKAEKEPLRGKNPQPAEQPKQNITPKQENKQTDNNNKQTNNKPVVPDNHIGKDKAEELALKDAGISAENARIQRTELDRERKITIYEVEFTADGMEYDYEIDAETGKILKSKREWDD